MTERRPVRLTTTALLDQAAKDFQTQVQRIANMAVADGEVPPGSNLDIGSSPIAWTVQVPDAESPRELKLEKLEEA